MGYAEARREKICYDKASQEDRLAQPMDWELLKNLRGQPKQYAKVYLANRDGLICTYCNKALGPLEQASIDHIDAIRSNNRRWNLRLMHMPCNDRMWKLYRQHSVSVRQSCRKGEREVAAPTDSPTVPQEFDAFSNQVAFKKQQPVREAAMLYVLEGLSKSPSESYDIDKVAWDLSEEVQLSFQTTKNYIRKLCTRSGPFNDPAFTKPKGQLQFKHKYWQTLSPKELYQRFPCDTQILKADADWLDSIAQERLASLDSKEAENTIRKWDQA